MTKLAQFCQNFAQQLQEETEQANNIAGSGEEEIPKISVNLGDLADIQAHRQRQLEAQVTVFKLLDTDVISCVCVCVCIIIIIIFYPGFCLIVISIFSFQ